MNRHVLSSSLLKCDTDSAIKALRGQLTISSLEEKPLCIIYAFHLYSIDYVR